MLLTENIRLADEADTKTVTFAFPLRKKEGGKVWEIGAGNIGIVASVASASSATLTTERKP